MRQTVQKISELCKYSCSVNDKFLYNLNISLSENMNLPLNLLNKAILIPFSFLLIIWASDAVNGQSISELDKRYGFRELKFGMNVDTLLKNSIFFESKRNGKLYEKIAEELFVDGCSVTGIDYAQCNRKLCGVHIYAKIDNFYCIKQRLESHYGLPTGKNYHDGTWYYWWEGNEVTLILQLKNEQSEIILWSKSIAKDQYEFKRGGTVSDF